MHGLTFMLLLLHHLWISIELFKTQVRDFPGSLVVKTSPSNAGGASLIPGQGTKIPHASWPKYQNVKQKRYCNKFSKNLKKKKDTSHCTCAVSKQALELSAMVKMSCVLLKTASARHMWLWTS